MLGLSCKFMVKDSKPVFKYNLLGFYYEYLYYNTREFVRRDAKLMSKLLVKQLNCQSSSSFDLRYLHLSGSVNHTSTTTEQQPVLR